MGPEKFNLKNIAGFEALIRSILQIFVSIVDLSDELEETSLADVEYAEKLEKLVNKIKFAKLHQNINLLSSLQAYSRLQEDLIDDIEVQNDILKLFKKRARSSLNNIKKEVESTEKFVDILEKEPSPILFDQAKNRIMKTTELANNWISETIEDRNEEYGQMILKSDHFLAHWDITEHIDIICKGSTIIYLRCMDSNIRQYYFNILQATENICEKTRQLTILFETYFSEFNDKHSGVPKTGRMSVYLKRRTQRSHTKLDILQQFKKLGQTSVLRKNMF